MKLLAGCSFVLCFLSVSAEDLDMKEVLSKIQNELLRGTFKARVEVSMAMENNSKNMTYTINEYHDALNGVHSLTFVSEKKRLFYYANLPGKNFITVEADGTCNQTEIASASSDIENFVTAKNKKLSKEYFLGPTGIIMRIPEEAFAKELEISDDVRGIKAKMFVHSDGSRDPDWQIFIHFASADWKNYVISKNNIPFPLRIVMNDNSVSYQIEFFEVEDLAQKDLSRLGDALQLPFHNEGCSLQKPDGMDVPDIGKLFSFTTEHETLTSSRDWFDTDSKIYRTDSWNGSPVIQDDYHGIIYTLGDVCVSKPNSAATADDIIANGAQSASAMIVQAYYNMTNKYYIGETVIRGMPVDIWEASKSGMFSLARFYFTKKNVAFSINHRNESQVLVKAVLYPNSDQNLYIDNDVSNFYSSSNSLDFRKFFNIEECQYESTFVQILYKTNKEFNKELMALSNALEEVSALTDEAILQSTEISALQLPYIKVDVVDSTHIRAYAKILASPSYQSSFTERSEKYQHYSAAPSDASTPEACAKQCVETHCETMLYCPGDKHCFLQKSKNVSTWGGVVVGSAQDCSAFDKVPTVSKYAYKTLDNITNILEGAILMGLPQFRFRIKNEEGEFDIQATEFHSHLSEFNDKGSLGPYTQAFEKKSIDEKQPSSTVIENVATVGECYRKCALNKDVACGSFSICTKSKRCVLSGLNINSESHHDSEQKEAIISATADCSIFTMNFLGQFDRVPGKTRISGNKAQDKEKTAGDCAADCRQKEYDLLINCRSFDFCPRKQMCFFYDTHYNWDGGNSSLEDNSDCDHYALRYSADYTAMGKYVLEGLPTKKVEGVSLEDCAKQCTEFSKDECKTISFCDDVRGNGEKQTCYMYAALIEEAKGITQINSCTVYMKDTIVNSEVINPDRQTDSERTTVVTGMSDTGFAFLLIVMLLIGGAIGGYGFVQKDRIMTLVGRSGSGGGPVSTTISYNRQDDERNEA